MLYLSIRKKVNIYCWYLLRKMCSCSINLKYYFMFKKHPKGLVAASLANMGERFGFYVMMALLTLFLMSKFGITGTQSSFIGSVFYFGIYILALVGGIIADKTKKYKQTIMTGIVLMTVGYVILAIPTPTPAPPSSYYLFMGITILGLFIIAFGNGLFKGNLQALVGQMYDNEEYKDKRDAGFSLFYMFINIGAVFAPVIAVLIRNWWVQHNGFVYNASITDVCHQYLAGGMAGDPTKVAEFEEAAKLALVDSSTFTNLTDFSTNYIGVFTTGFHYAFAIAIVAMLISLTVFVINKNKFPDPALKAAKDNLTGKQKEEVKMDAAEVKQRLYALFAVFAVVIFFWLSFHQNGHSLTLFAKDYTDLSWLKINFFGIASIEGAELFQTFNPLFVVLLTPVVLAFFGWLKSKGKEPSTPKKIGIGMGIAALGFIVMLIGSMDLPLLGEFKAMGVNAQDGIRVTPFLLIGTYLILTIAELFISPLGLSFVSKVAPPHLQGLMQGAWLGTTAVANLFLFIGPLMYENIPIWMTWGVFALACTFSMCMMLCMIKWLERITK